MTGAEIDELVQDLAAQRHLLAIHFPDSRRVTARGWVDWVIIGPRGLLFREVKGDSDALSPEQKALGYALRANGADYSVWDTIEYVRGAIEAQLDRVAAAGVRIADG